MTSFSTIFEDHLRRFQQLDPAPDNLLRWEKRIDFDRTDVLQWIAAFDLPALFYFKEKEGRYELGGLGSALEVAADNPAAAAAKLDRLWAVCPERNFFGGLSFFPSHADAGEWAGFPRVRFTLPLIEILRNPQGCRVVFNFRLQGNRSEDYQQIQNTLHWIDARRHGKKPAALARITGQTLEPRPEEWHAVIARVLEQIRENPIRKIVLSRKRILTAHAGWDPLELLKTLSRIDEPSFTFLYKISHQKAFLGRSPERLFSLCDGTITVEALAGTRPRGIGIEADRALEQELQTSPKELEEHRIVSEYAHRKMTSLCRAYQTPKVEVILKLMSVQHLLTQFTGELAAGDHPLAIALSLHPTPAICGWPTEKTLELIPGYESFRRGWYAAPIGWMNRHAADFAVGIRSALIHGPRLHLFAGAGIVRQSNAQAEWNETEVKMQNFVSRLRGLDEKGNVISA